MIRRPKSMGKMVLFLGALVSTISPPTSGVPIRVSYKNLGRLDAEIFMTVGASDPQIAAVRSAVTSSPLVRRWAYLDHAAAFKIFEQTIGRKNPQIAQGVHATDVPVSIRLQLRDPNANLTVLQQFGNLGGVQKVQASISPQEERYATEHAAVCDSEPRQSDLLAFLRIGTPPDQVSAVMAALAADPAIRSETLISQTDALLFFRCVYPRRAVVEVVQPNDLPIGFKILAAPGVSLRRLQASLQRLPEVTSVNANSNRIPSVAPRA